MKQFFNFSYFSMMRFYQFCYKGCESIDEARVLEKLVKSYKGGNAFKKIISGNTLERWPSG